MCAARSGRVAEIDLGDEDSEDDEEEEEEEEDELEDDEDEDEDEEDPDEDMVEDRTPPPGGVLVRALVGTLR